MKILHTSDWHIGKRLGRHDRMDEFADVLGRGRGDRRRARGRPGPRLGRRLGPADAPRWTRSRSGCRRSLRLADAPPGRRGRRQPRLPRAVRGARARCCVPRGVHLIGTDQAPRRRRAARSRRPRRCPRWSPCFPFLREGTGRRLHEGSRRVVQRPTRERVAAITGRVQRGAGRARPATDLVPILIAHFMVGGVQGRSRRAARRARAAHGRRLRRHRRRRSRRARSTWRWATSTRRRRCRARRCRRSTPARCSRSTSARPASSKRVVIVDAEPGRLAVDRERSAARAGRRLVRVHRRLGRDRGPRRRARRRVPRPHGEDDGHRHDPRPSARTRRSRTS